MPKLTLLLILLPVVSFCQPPDLPKNAAGKYEYAGTVKVAGASAEQLYDKTKQLSQYEFRSAKTGQDNDATKTMNRYGMVYARVPNKYDERVDYMLSIQCMDGSYKYIINNFEMYKRPLSDANIFKGWSTEKLEDVKGHIIGTVEGAIDQIKKHMDPNYLVPLVEMKANSYGPPVTIVTETLTNGTTLSIRYEQPELKGKTIGINIAPFMGSLWCICQNEPTLFETDKPINVEGKPLPAGRYILNSLMQGEEWTINFYQPESGETGGFTPKLITVCKVKVMEGKASSYNEKLIFTISKEGMISLLYGDTKVAFKVN